MTDSQTFHSSCPKCHDSGYVFKLDEKGNDVAVLCECQFQKKTSAYLKQSGFPVEEFSKMTLETFKTNTEEQKQMKLLAEKFITNHSHWLGYFGHSGAGKTHICIAVCQELVSRYHMRFKYAPYRTIIRELRANIFNESKYDDILHDLVEVDVLYIDDLLKLSQSQNGDTIQDELRVLYDIVNERYLNGKTTIFSSEYSLKEILGIDEALGSRIRQMIGEYGFKCQGENQRL